MAAHERRIDRARHYARRSLASLGEDLRDARLDAGLSQRVVGAAAGLSHTEVIRVERGLVPAVPYETLALIGAALGLDVPLRAYPGGDPVRDKAQLALLARFRSALPASIRHRTEVPLRIAGDRRAWDEVIEGPGWSVPVEAETRIRDTQALRRRVALKARDGNAPLVLLVVADTRHNRRALRLAADDFRDAFPRPPAEIWAALRAGTGPAGSGILLV